MFSMEQRQSNAISVNYTKKALNFESVRKLPRDTYNIAFKLFCIKRKRSKEVKYYYETNFINTENKLLK